MKSTMNLSLIFLLGLVTIFTIINSTPVVIPFRYDTYVYHGYTVNMPGTLGHCDLKIFNITVAGSGGGAGGSCEWYNNGVRTSSGGGGGASGSKFKYYGSELSMNDEAGAEWVIDIGAGGCFYNNYYGDHSSRSCNGTYWNAQEGAGGGASAFGPTSFEDGYVIMEGGWEGTEGTESSAGIGGEGAFDPSLDTCAGPIFATINCTRHITHGKPGFNGQYTHTGTAFGGLGRNGVCPTCTPDNGSGGNGGSVVSNVISNGQCSPDGIVEFYVWCDCEPGYSCT